MKNRLVEITRALVYKKLRALECKGKHSGGYLDPHCDACAPLYHIIYPQGWSHYPGDVCEHGVYVGGCGIDYMCGPCEDGYEYVPSFRKVVRTWWRAVRAQEVLSDPIPLAG